MHVCMHAQSCQTLCDPWTVACQAPLCMGFSRQEYWSGLPCPPPGDAPDPGTDSCLSCLLHWQAGSLLLVPPGKFRALRPHIKVRYKVTNEIGSNGDRNWLCGSLLPTHIEYTKRLGKSGREFLDHCCASPQGKGIRGSFVFTSEPKTRPLKKPFREWCMSKYESEIRNFSSNYWCETQQCELEGEESVRKLQKSLRRNT